MPGAARVLFALAALCGVGALVSVLISVISGEVIHRTTLSPDAVNPRRFVGRITGVRLTPGERMALTGSMDHVGGGTAQWELEGRSASGAQVREVSDSQYNRAAVQGSVGRGFYWVAEDETG